MKRWFERFKAGAQQEAALNAHLDKLGEMSDSHRVVVYAGLTRVLVSEAGGGLTVRIPGDFVLEPGLGVTGADLTAAGWSPAAGSTGREWHRTVSSKKQARSEVTRAVKRWFGDASGGLFSVALEPDATADHPKLRHSMRALAGARTHTARHTVYRELVQANLALAVTGIETGALAPWEDDEDLEGTTVWRCFTGPAAIEDHGEGIGVVTTSGVRLLRAALDRRIGALRIDFSSNVGGELYAHELASIAEAIPAARPPGWTP